MHVQTLDQSERTESAREGIYDARRGTRGVALASAPSVFCQPALPIERHEASRRPRCESRSMAESRPWYPPALFPHICPRLCAGPVMRSQQIRCAGRNFRIRERQSPSIQTARADSAARTIASGRLDRWHLVVRIGQPYSVRGRATDNGLLCIPQHPVAKENRVLAHQKLPSE